ncbi:MAG: hypothetical protein IT223_00415, partial [Crocinitomicaceae bacterium]|nr:hypothetical protein [Crocinitomicaceae bacterium]
MSSGLQAWSQFDYQFWMPPIWETGVSDQNSPSELFITTPYSSSVGVHVETPDGTTFVYNGTVTSGAPLSIPLSATLGQTNIPNQVITNNGFIITSTAPIQCIHKVSAEFNQTLITLKGKNGRGKDFWCGSQVRNNSSSYGSNEFHFISVMAMEDNTSISIATPYNMFLAGPGDLANPYNITLNKNQCYLIRSNVTNQHVTGAHVTSNKDIVVISGSTHTRISGSGADAADGGTDQLVPVPLIGTSYAVIKGNNNNPYDYAIVVATQNSTKVFIDGSGSPSATINAGQYFDWTLTGSFGAPHSIRTDKPSYVYHVSGTSQDDEVDMSIMPQLQCTGSRYIEFSKFTSNTSQQIMQLLVSPAAESTLKVNNVFYQSVPGVIYNNIPGLPGWKSVTLPTNSLSNNNIVKSNGFFHAGWLTGNAGKTGAYGYLSGFDDAFEFLDPTSNLPTNIYQLGPLCQGQSMDHCLKVVSCAGDNEITSYSGNLGTIVLAPPSSPYDSCFRYTAPANFAGYDTVNFIVTNSFGFQSSIDIVFKVVKPNTPINAGPDQTLCSVNTTTLSAVNPDPLANGYWTVAQGTGVIVTPNSPTTSVTGLSPGVNTFIWHQDYPSCAVNNVDLVQVFVFSGTPPNANAGPDASLCSGTTYTMQANNPGFTGQGTWEILSGNATISNINSANALVTNLAIGVNTFRWNISNGGCPGGETNDVMIIYVYNQNHQAANAGSDQTACQGSFSSIAIAGNAPQVPATGQWSVVSGSGNFANANASSTSVSGLTIGTNVFRWTISNGPCGTLTDDVQITVFNPASPAANAGPDQSICLPTNSATLAGNSPISPATGLWTVVQGTGSFANANLPNTSVSGLTLGTNRFRWTLNNGPCANPITFDEIIITVYPASQPAIDAGPNQQLCFSGSPLTATLSGSSITAPGTGLWTVVTGSGTFASPTLPSTTVSGMSIGNNVFQWTVTNGSCGSPQSDQVTITIFNNGIAPANAGPDAQLCTPSTSYTMQGVAPSLPATGVWTLIAGSGAITTPSSPTSTITNLGVGNNVFRWTINNGACGGSNFDEVTISVFNNSAAAANAGTDREFCFDGVTPVTATMAANAATAPGIGTWTLVSGGGTIISPNTPTTNITSLPVGINIFQWTINNGACGTTSDQVVITVYNPNQTAANAGPDQQICSTTPSVSLSANTLLSPATGIWTVVSGTGVFSNATSPSTSVTGMSLGNNVYQWTINNGPCSTPAMLSDQVVITVFNSNQAAANAGPDQSICSTTTSITLAGNTATLPATGLWTVIAGSGTFSNASSPTSSVTGMSIGTNIYQWTITNSSCGSPTMDQMTVTVFSSTAPTANAGADQPFCTPTSSTNFAGNTPLFPSTGQWTLISGSGTIANPASPTSLVSGLGIGANTFQWTINNGSCGTITSDQVTFTLFDSGQAGPDAGPDASLCTPQSTYVMQAAAVASPALGTWSLISGTGTISNPNNSSATISGLGVGTNVFRWTISNGPCPVGASFDEMTIFVFNANQLTANAGADKSLCYDGVNPVNTTMSGSAVIAPGSGVWTLIQGGGTITTPASPTTTITNLPVGHNIFRWTVSNGACTPPSSFDEISIWVYRGTQPAADAGADQQLCSTTISTTLAGNNVTFPATGLWTVVQGTANFANASNPTTTITGLSLGTNILQWTISNGPCSPPTTSDQVTIIVYNNAQPAANAGIDKNICSNITSIAMTGNTATSPATGLWTVVSGTGVFSNATSPVSTVTGMSIGTNIYQWTISNGVCGSPTSDQVTVTVYNVNAPIANAGADQSFCLPTTATVFAGNTPFSPATGLWTLISGSGTITTPTSANSAVTGLGVGSNTFRWTINNGACNSITSDDVTILIFDSGQSGPSAGPDVSLCTPQSTYVMQANSVTFPAVGTWSLVSGAGSISNVNNPTATISGLGVGTSVFRWTITNGPCPAGSNFDDIIISVYDANQPPANAGPDQSFCYGGVSPVNAVMNASITTAPGAGTWTLISGGGTIGSVNSPTTSITNLPVGTNIFRWTVSNGPCAPPTSFDEVSIFVFPGNQAPANAGSDQQLCSTNPNTVLAGNPYVAPATGVWTVVLGSATFANASNPLTAVTNLGVGTNVLQWTISNGSCVPSVTSDQVTITVFNNAQTSANAGSDISICSTQPAVTLTGTPFTAPATALWTLVSGAGTIASPSNSSTSVSNLGVGLNIFEYTISNGPCAAPTSDQITVTVFSSTQSVANAGPDQSICLPQTTTMLAGNVPIFPATGTWTRLSGSGTITNPSNAGSTVTGLAVGLNSFQWTISNGPCSPPATSDIVNIYIYDNTQPVANAGPDVSFCTPTSTYIMQANSAIFPAQGTWTLISGTATIANVNNPVSNISGLGIGTNVFRWTMNNGPCPGGTTFDDMTIFVYDQNQLPANAGPDQSFCFDGVSPVNATMSASAVISPGSGTWTLVQGSGNIVFPNSPITAVTNLAVGENIFRWTVSNGPCVPSNTNDLVSIFVYPGNQAPANAGSDQQLCSNNPVTTLAGNAAVFPASGLWTIVQGSATFADVSSPTTGVSNLGIGTNILRWTIINGPCVPGSTFDEVSITVFNNAQAPANAGADQSICSVQTSVTVSGTTTSLPATALWTLVSGTGTINSPTSNSTTITGLSIGLNVFEYTVSNGPCA